MVAPWPSGPGSESVPSSVSVNPVSASSLVALPTRRRMPPRSVRRVRPCPEGGAPSPERLSVSLAPWPWPPAACPWHAVTARPGAGAAPGGPAVWPKSVSGPRLGSVPPRIHASSLVSRSGRTIPRAWYTCGIAASGCPSPVSRVPLLAAGRLVLGRCPLRASRRRPLAIVPASAPRELPIRLLLPGRADDLREPLSQRRKRATLGRRSRSG